MYSVYNVVHALFGCYNPKMDPSVTFCSFEGAKFLIFGPNVPALVYYAHLPNIIISLCLAFFILFQNRKMLANQVLFGTILSFVIWAFFALVFWATNNPGVVIFSWSMDVLFEPLVYVGCLYLLYVLFEKRDLPLTWKSMFTILYVPFALLVPTRLTLSGVDLSTCLAVEGPVALYYSYFIEIVISIWAFVYATGRILYTANPETKKERLFLSMGVLFLLFSFGWGNIIGSFTEDWKLGLYGLFGMPVFIAFLAYTIVKYRTFNIRVVGSVALVLALCALNFSLLFVQHVEVFRGVAALTFTISSVFGYLLIRNVRNAMRQRALIEQQERALEVTNNEQEALLRFVSHEIKGYLTKSEAVFAEIGEGTYGEPTPRIKQMAEGALAEMRKGVDMVMYILKAANFKKGTVGYEKHPFDLKAVVRASIVALQPLADERHITVTSSVSDEEFTMTGDESKISEHVTRNLIDNALRYTLAGGKVHVSLSHCVNGDVCFAVTDTGIGITKEDMRNLFTEGGHGKDSITTNVHSTGYGLFIAKQVVGAHNGRVWAESDGEGKGSKFVVEFPRE